MEYEIVDLVVVNPECVVISHDSWVNVDFVAVNDGRIHSMGLGPPPESRSTVNASSCVMSPGLINTHHHFFQNLARAYAPAANADLKTWLDTVYELWPRVDDEAIYLAAWIACAELLLGGCTLSVDHFSLTPVPGNDGGHLIAQAARETGIRLHLMRGVMDRPFGNGSGGSVSGRLDKYAEVLEELVAREHSFSVDSSVSIGVAPPTIFSVSESMLRDLVNLGRDKSLRLHIHVSESVDEVQASKMRSGLSPVRVLEDLGWLGPDTWVAHAVAVDNQDLELLAASETGVSHCPSSNMLLGNGRAPIAKMLDKGISVALGTDGSASSDMGSVWLEARNAMLLARVGGGASGLSAGQAFKLATVNGARCIGRDNIGTLRVGDLADFVIWDFSGVQYSGASNDPIDALIRCGPPVARDVAVAGNLVVNQGKLITPGIKEKVQNHGRVARTVQSVVDKWL